MREKHVSAYSKLYGCQMSVKVNVRRRQTVVGLDIGMKDNNPRVVQLSLTEFEQTALTASYEKENQRDQSEIMIISKYSSE